MKRTNSNCKVSIIVPTFNRRKDIEKFVSEIYKQGCKDFEVIIIDDHGDEGISDLIPNDSDLFSLFRLEENKGQAYVRNFGIKKAKYDILVFMDDDAWFEDSNAINNVLSYFKKDSKLGCLMFNIKEPNRENLSERFDLVEGQEIGEFIACGVAFRKEAINSAGGFSSILHSYGEETDISLSLLQKAYTIKFTEKVVIYHNYLPSKRSKEWVKRFKHNTVRNDMIIVGMRYPILLVPIFIPLKTLSHLLYSIRNNDSFTITLIQSFKALISTFLLIPTIIKNRESVSFKTYKKWRTLRWKINT